MLGRLVVNVKNTGMNSMIDLTELVEIGRTGYQIVCDNFPAECASAKSSRGDTLLHVAASRGSMNEVCYLLQTGAQINAQGEFLFTPLHCAAIGGHNEIYDYLLSNGGDKDMRDCYGYTADMYFDD